MELSEKTVKNCVIISITGNIVTSAEIKRLERRIFSVFNHCGKIILDMSQTEIVSSTAVKTLLEVWRSIYNDRGLLILACMQTATRITFSINKAYAFLETGTVTEAMEKLKC